MEAVSNMTVPTTLSRKKSNNLLMLISSMISQNRSTTSWTVFSQTPCNSTLWRLHYFHTRNKNTLTESQVTSLQNPWIHGVPLGRISNGSTGLQESFKVVRQQRLHEFSTKKIDLMRSNISWKYFHLWTKLEISNQQKIYDFIKSLKGMIRTSVTSSSPTRKKIIGTCNIHFWNNQNFIFFMKNRS